MRQPVTTARRILSTIVSEVCAGHVVGLPPSQRKSNVGFPQSRFYTCPVSVDQIKRHHSDGFKWIQRLERTPMGQHGGKI